MSPPVSPALLAELLDAHGATLELYASQWTDEAGDCVQEALLELARQSTTPQRPASWLFCVVRRKALNRARGAARRRAREQLAARQRLEASEASGPAEVAAMTEALCSLSSVQREVVTLRCWGNLTWHEIAEVAASSPSRAQREYARALSRLKTLLEDEPCPSSR